MSNSNLQRAFDCYLIKFNEPSHDLNCNIARVIVCLFFIWKLLSRDFSTFAIVPESALHYYPFSLYARDGIVITMGIPLIVDLVTFHWIHWFLPFPGTFLFQFIQWFVIALTATTLIFGRGPSRTLAVGTYIGLIYLWGFLFRTGMEQDAVDMYLLALLVLIASNYHDVAIFRFGTLAKFEPNAGAGRTRSLLFLVLIFYYFASGTNKLSDIYPIGWFQYDLIEAVERFRQWTNAGHYVYSPPIFDSLKGQYWLDVVAVPMVYLSHLASPLVFFKRYLVYEFALFYFVFHLMTFGVSISFTGYIFVWLLLVDYGALTVWLRRKFAQSAQPSEAL